MDCDVMLNALVGISGLRPSMAAIENAQRRGSEPGRPVLRIALANKETLVAGGLIVTRAAAAAGVPIIPVDSEHSAIFQCLAGNDAKDVQRIILTASGGPFRGYSEADLKNVGVEDALGHPNWSMGAKITIDSATMMNKAFEIIEAKWLFDLSEEHIDVLVHPGSIIHSLVVFRDGAVLAQLGLPSMKPPISYALFHPSRPATAIDAPDFAALSPLEMEAPSGFALRSIELARAVLRESDKGCDSPGAYLNGADEELTGLFLAGKIGFTDIVDSLERLMQAHKPHAVGTLDELLKVDAQARADVASEWL
jgi:1-deoxy-D-xylulose-5-phosphate reductoisomerase